VYKCHHLSLDDHDIMHQHRRWGTLRRVAPEIKQLAVNMNSYKDVLALVVILFITFDMLMTLLFKTRGLL
jgi:hypothetical protein